MILFQEWKCAMETHRFDKIVNKDDDDDDHDDDDDDDDRETPLIVRETVQQKAGDCKASAGAFSVEI